MLIELIGPGAVGKSTVGPLLADLIGVPHFAGQGFYDLDGRRLTGRRLWADRIVSTTTRPGLMAAALQAHPGPTQQRLSFALTTCRRERFAARVAAKGSGVFSSGPIHWLCQESTRFQHDLTTLLPRVIVSDVYVRLTASTEEVTRRLAARGGKSQERIAEHHLWIRRYLDYADSILDRLDRPVIAVDSDAEPDEVAGIIAERLEANPKSRSDREKE